MEWVAIPTGTVLMGDPRSPDAAPPTRLPLVGFAIGKYVVTNSEFGEFIRTGGYEHPEYWSAMGWKWQEGRLGEAREPGFWQEPRLNGGPYPVVGVSWYEAVAFCRWMTAQGGGTFRLPTEAEWEYAARGADNTRRFPWGDALERGRANTAEAGFGATTPIMHFPSGKSPFGAWDMAGNVFEWTSSKWGKNWQTLEFPYPYRADDGREDGEGGGARVIRGGSWFTNGHEATCYYRARYLAGSRASNIGFRVLMER